MSMPPHMGEPSSPNRLKEELLKNATDKNGNNKKMMNPLKLPDIFSYFDTPNREKKWAAPNADVTDYFNYGLTEETFKLYAQKVKNLFNKLQKTGGAHFKPGTESDKFFEDRLPISHGGLENIDDNVLKTLSEAEWDLLYTQSDGYLDLIFKQQHSHVNLDDIRKGINNTNNSVNNVYGLKKDPPPPVVMVQPPPTPSLPRPQPPPVSMPHPIRMNPPPVGPHGMYPPPSMHPQMDYPNFNQMMPRHPSYMGFQPKPDYFNPMYPPVMQGPGGGRPPMEMPPQMQPQMEMKKKREEQSEESDESSDEKEKGKSQGKKEEKRKRSKSRERKHKSHHRDKDSEGHQEGKHHHHRDRHDRDEGSRRHGDDDKGSKHYTQSSREREREEVKNEDRYPKDDGDQSMRMHGGRERTGWQKGYINNLIGSQVKDGRERKDKRR